MRHKAAEFFSSDELKAQQTQAAQILIQKGDIEDAVTLLCESSDWKTLIGIILSHADSLIHQGRTQTLSVWITRLPKSIVNESPWLLFWLGACELGQDPLKAKDKLSLAFTLFESQDDPAGLYACWGMIASIYNITYAPVDVDVPWIETFENLQNRHPNVPSPLIEARVCIGLVALLRIHHLGHPKFEYWLKHSEELLDAIEDKTERLLAIYELAFCYSWSGHTVGGASLLSKSAYLIDEETSSLGRLLFITAQAMFEWLKGEADQCATLVKTGFQIADEYENYLVNPYLCVFGVYGAVLIGDTEKANLFLDHIEPYPDSQPLQSAIYYHLHTLVNLYQGSFDEALQHARESLICSDQVNAPFINVLYRLTLASVLIELNNLAEAKLWLDQALAIAKICRSATLDHLADMGLAIFALKKGKTDEALNQIQNAITNAKAAGLVQATFIHRNTLSELYTLGLNTNLEVPHLQQQIRYHRLLPENACHASTLWPFPLRIYTMGRFSIVKDNTPLKTDGKGARKPLQLLKTLIASGCEHVSQAKIQTVLWSDAEGDNAQHSFETTLYRLRKLISVEALIMKDGYLSLNQQICWVDSSAFEYLLNEIKQAINTADELTISKLTERLMTLYQGAFLDDDHDQPLIATYHERLRSRLIGVLGVLSVYWRE